jgi:3'-5' exoribonuclease
MLPPHKNYNLADVQKLITMIESLQISQLKDFMYRVFSDEILAMTYLSGKSSQSYHHNEPGGLLRHSLQVAEIVSWHKAVVPDFHLEIGIVAALLHDVAKSKMWYNRPSAEVSAPILNHDLMTTEIIATQLRSLESDWKDGAAFLRDCLNYKANKDIYYRKRHHVPTVINILWYADSTSAASDDEASILKSKKARQKNLQQGGVRYYFYDPPPPPKSHSADNRKE